MPNEDVIEVTQTYSQSSSSPLDVIDAMEVSGDIGTHIFPSDLYGRTQASAHVMKIQINQNTAMSALAPATQNIVGDGSGFGSIRDGVISLPNIFSVFGTLSDAVSNVISDPNSFAQTLIDQGLGDFKRAKGAIFLYIPNPMVYTNAMDYEDVSLTSLATDTLKTAVGVIPIAGATVNRAIDAARGVVEATQRLRGLPINPKVEILFKNIPQRRFQFDFLFAPTSEAESIALKNIIQVLRSEAAPEEIGIAGIVWKAPSTFDISFEHNNAQNLHIPKIQESVLEQIDVDYEPSGHWATFHNGYPVAVRLQLRFREREPNHKKKILEGY